MTKIPVKRLLWSVPLILFMAFISGAGMLVWEGLQDQLGPADVALVLGNTVDFQGRPSPRLKARLDRTVELFREGYFKMIIVSGGVGREGFPEGTAMQTYLVSQGVPKESVIVDNLGLDTKASAVNAKLIMDSRHLKSILIVSQYFHVPRCRLAADKAGIASTYSAHAYFFELRDLYSIAREIPACIKYFFMSPSGSAQITSP